MTTITASEPTTDTNTLRTSLPPLAVPDPCYLQGVHVCDVVAPGEFSPETDPQVLTIAQRCLEESDAMVVQDAALLPSDASSALAIPVFFDGDVQSVIVLFSKAATETMSDPVGVFEVWRPVGPHDEVALREGYYGKLERFQNVSSFVRFEKGNGLPGVVWDREIALVQDDLANHMGFLRAAGASADLLNSALGVPIFSDQFLSTAVLIQSRKTPMARAMEVWKVNDSECELTSQAYGDVEKAFRLDVGTKVPTNTGILGLVTQNQRTVLIEDMAALLLTRPADKALPCPTAGLAIPFFDGTVLSSITLLMF
ncbi:GAF domain-containing protein [Rhodopirellula halodulae]|uniref:GAF domain-containing protein n=1 Tax=Rhodopirellula halodulae TaxID=2894198 RepID=UPI001E2989BC|nr:GAF domain-containing protein [Rhodopirellula sp. JC737]MCC9655071.1 GAF domain-containing protein [Rhodopirellula sp. JC737]